jgi:hypothetical protein
MQLALAAIAILALLGLGAAAARAQKAVPGSHGSAAPHTVQTKSLDSVDKDAEPTAPDDADTHALDGVPHDDADVQPDAAPPADVPTAGTEPLANGNPDTPYVEPKPDAKAKAAPAPHEAPAGPYAEWIKRLDEGAQKLRDAQQRVEDAEAAVTRMLTRNYPSGAAKAKILKERDDAHAALAKAQEALPALLDEARADGVPQSVLDPYEASAPQS